MKTQLLWLGPSSSALCSVTLAKSPDLAYSLLICERSTYSLRGGVRKRGVQTKRLGELGNVNQVVALSGCCDKQASL